ncbi:MAG: periplasmic heavy metal sensor [Deltaproteobacteria bacterium]|jgi:Spy/CpxP family protein refolding chaperone|nr:periplasmic heavy metal sensor [Deltaproteobacteria bacterium]
MLKLRNLSLIILAIALLSLGALALAQDQGQAPGPPDQSGPAGPPPNPGDGPGDQGYYPDGPDDGYGQPGWHRRDGRRWHGGDRRWHGRNRHGRVDGRPALTDEQLTSLDKLRADHWAKVEPIMDQIQDNRLLYGALADNPNANIDEVKKTIAELSRLRKELRDERAAFDKSLQDQGLPAFGPGYPGHDGPGWGCRKGHAWLGDDGPDYPGPYGDADRRWHRGGGPHRR